MSVPWEMTVDQLEDAARQADRANRADICHRCGVVALHRQEPAEQVRLGEPVFFIAFNCNGHSRSVEPLERVHE